ncbi:MAG: DUF3662 and FHA domain-containing protein [Anaerosomatales bacterium]|nr:FHA domain-containing protein [Coriobacteriia bacterium]MDF1542131.1 DUF3662 and FHA domain-containing protein [Anaerosomatales bacterium]MDT8433634.1 DUF3662 and FHA domain-containing protein [Anaerosomatales bacterium]
MSILSDFEDRIASAVEGVFAGAFRSPVQPAEIAKALGKAMDDRRAVGVGKVYVPHAYTVALSPADEEGIGGFRSTLAGELATFLVGHAAERGYTLSARPSITFTVHDDLRLGRFRVAATPASEGPPDVEHLADNPPPSPPPPPIKPATQPPSPKNAPIHGIATVTVSGVEHDVALAGERVCVGRLSSCDIKLSDANVSREHAAFVREGAGWAIEDLDSTNGTYLNSERVTFERLRDGDVVSVGASELYFHEPRG